MRKFNPEIHNPETVSEVIALLDRWAVLGIPREGCVHERAAQAAEVLSRAAVEEHLTPTIAPVLAEIRRATAKFPSWPADPLHALAVVGEEFGELSKAVLQQVYEPAKNKRGLYEVREEAIQTAAMAIRFLANIDEYTFTPAVPRHTGSPLYRGGGLAPGETPVILARGVDFWSEVRQATAHFGRPLTTVRAAAPALQPSLPRLAASSEAHEDDNQGPQYEDGPWAEGWEERNRSAQEPFGAAPASPERASCVAEEAACALPPFSPALSRSCDDCAHMVVAGNGQKLCGSRDVAAHRCEVARSARGDCKPEGRFFQPKAAGVHGDTETPAAANVVEPKQQAVVTLCFDSDSAEEFSVVDWLQAVTSGLARSGVYVRVTAVPNLSQQAADAARYRELRAMHWHDAPLAVVAHPRQSIKTGGWTLSGDRLDLYLDGVRGESARPAAVAETPAPHLPIVTDVSQHGALRMAEHLEAMARAMRGGAMVVSGGLRADEPLHLFGEIRLEMPKEGA